LVYANGSFILAKLEERFPELYIFGNHDDHIIVVGSTFLEDGIQLACELQLGGGFLLQPLLKEFGDVLYSISDILRLELVIALVYEMFVMFLVVRFLNKIKSIGDIDQPILCM